jgi:hypothetical protein
MSTKNIFEMNMNMSLNCKSDSKIYELREDLRECLELLNNFFNNKNKEVSQVYEILYNFKNSFYPYKQKFSTICTNIQDSIILTDDEIDEILGGMEFDMQNIFFSNDEIFEDLIEVLGDDEKTALLLKESQDSITNQFESFDKKLTELYEKINM